jgi:cell wall-associated NlpC family hydrolase
VIHSRLAHRIGAAVAAVVSTAGLMMTAGSAGAMVAAPQPTVGQVQAKLNQLTAKENYLIQQYDQATQDLASARQRLSLIDHEVTVDQAQFQVMRDAIGQIASVAYEDGGLTSTAAVLTSGSPQTLLAQSSILVHLSTSRDQQLQQFVLLASEISGAKQTAQRTEQAVAAIQNRLKAQKNSIQGLINQQQSLLASLTPAQQAGLIGSGGSSGGTYTGPTGTQADTAVQFAYNQLGCPYVYGGTGPCGAGFDCSGLTMAAWAAAGVSIPRTSYGQAGLPSVPLSALQPGDILEFAGDSHVGIYVGGGYLIDAPQPGMNVEKVSLHSSWYWSNLDGAVRP